jgi:hypothetical protein
VVVSLPLLRHQTDGANDYSEPLVFLLQQDDLYEFDIFTGDLRWVTRLILPEIFSADEYLDPRRTKVEIDAVHQNIYLIVAWGRSTNFQALNVPTGAALVRFNLATGEQHIIFDSTSVSNFALSPDGTRMVVFYYSGGYRLSRQNACMLDLSRLMCQPLNFDNAALALWFNNTMFLTRLVDSNPLRLVDVRTGITTPLIFPSEWKIYWGTPIAVTDSHMISTENALTQSVKFLSYDLYTHEIQAYPASEQFLTVSFLNISPNEQFLLYGDSSKSLLMELQTGRLIHEFTMVQSAEWINDDTLLMQGTLAEEDQTKIMRVDAVSGQLAILRSGDAAAGDLLIP